MFAFTQEDVIIMTITLFDNSSDTREVNKHLTQIGTASVAPTSFVDVIAPSFIINANNLFFSANYLYCDTLNRYYYIKNITLDNAKTMIIKCAVDVLYSFREQIKNCECVAIRSSNLYDLYLKDEKIPTENRVTTQIKKLKGGENFETANTFVFLTY